jgi:hypothetical protein
MKTYKKGDKRFAHYKLDGHSLRVTRDCIGIFRCYTSHPHDITEKVIDRILSSRAVEMVPYSTAMNGELWSPDCPASGVKTAINDPSSQLLFNCYSVDQLLADTSLWTLNALLDLWGVRSIPFVDLHATNQSALEVISRPLPVFYGRPIEGWVFKDGNQLNFEKWKPVKTIDLIVDDFTEGNGKWLGYVGSLVTRTAEGHVVANAGGMDDDTRSLVSQNRRLFRGRVVEIAYQYVGSGGRLRHPRFIRFRDDKNPSACTLDQDPDLEAHYAKNH